MSSSYSIIIPHRDCPVLLQRCLDSIPKRDDVQIIVVDDNSTPSIVDFEHFPGNDRDDVTIVFTKEGKGAGYARNVGLEYATGEWIVFADADDYFYPQGLNKLLDLVIPIEASVVLYQYEFYREDGSSFVYPDFVASVDTAEVSLVSCSDTNVLCRNAVMPWTKMVRREHLDKYHIHFDEIKWGNDMIYSTKLSLSIDSFFIAPILVYSHEWLPNSLVNKDLTLEMFFARAVVSIKRAVLLQRGGRLDYNIFTDQWFKRIYSRNYPYSVFLRVRCFFQLGPKYCIQNWRQFTKKPLFLTRLFIKRLIKKN